MADNESLESGGKSGGGNNSVLLVALLLLNTLAIGLGGYYVFINDTAQAQVAEGEKAEEAPAQEGEDGKPAVADVVEEGPLYDLKSFLVNLDEPGVNRYLKVSIQIQVKSPLLVDQIDKRLVPIRDNVLTYLSSLNLDQTQGTVNKEIIRSTIRNRINKTVKDSLVQNVFFSEFVIQ